MFVVDDDGNPAWEDIEYESENEIEFEQLWRANERRNNEGDVRSESLKDLKSASRDQQDQWFQVSKHKD